MTDDTVTTSTFEEAAALYLSGLEPSGHEIVHTSMGRRAHLRFRDPEGSASRILREHALGLLRGSSTRDVMAAMDWAQKTVREILRA